MNEKLTQDQNFDQIECDDRFWLTFGKTFENCTFLRCNFNNTSLEDTKFYECQFVDCDLSLVIVQDGIFQDVAFKGCKLSGILFGTVRPFGLEMRFEDCKLDHSSFSGVKLKKALFDKCSLKGADFSAAQLKEASFNGSDLQDAIFDNSNLEKADLSSAFNFRIDPEGNKIKGATFSLEGLPGLLTAYKIKIVP